MKRYSFIQSKERENKPSPQGVPISFPLCYLTKAITILVLFLAISFLCIPETRASHAVGIELTYECLGENVYEFTVNFYRDCSGIGAPTSFYITIASAFCNFNATGINLAQQGPPIEVSPLCADELPNSSCNGGVEQGVERYVYRSEFTLPYECPDWVFSISYCCRNPSIDNLLNASGENIYVEAVLDNSNISCNSSPVFNTPPISYICEGSLFIYSQNAFDKDGDSLVYTLINPLGASGAPISFNFGYSATYPVFTTSGSVLFNPITGQMSMTPNGLQVCVIALLIQEYRNGVLIGKTMRDIQINVNSCSNAQPVLNDPGLINLNGGTLVDSNSIEVCVGSSLSFDIVASDNDTGNPGFPPIIYFSEDFEIVTIPALPAGWSVNGNTGSDLFMSGNSTSASSSGFNVMPHTQFAYSNDDNCNCDKAADYLEMPSLDFSGLTGLVLKFEAFNALQQFGDISFIDVSIDGGVVWNQIYSIPPIPSNTWQTLTISLSAYDNQPDVRIRFHYDDQGTWGGGFAVDNISVEKPEVFATQNDALTLTSNLSSSMPGALLATSGLNPVLGSFSWTPSFSDIGAHSFTVTLRDNSCPIIGIRNYDFNIVVGGSLVSIISNSYIVNPGDTTQLFACLGVPINVGTGTAITSTITPYKGYYDDGRMQILYKGDDLIAVGVSEGYLSAIAFNIADKKSTNPYDNFIIKMGSTNFDTLTNFVSGLTTVYGPVSYTSVASWNTHVLDIPYKWDGISNILIEICFDNSNFSLNDDIYYRTTAYNSVVYKYTDSESGCTLFNPYTSTDRPNIRLFNCSDSLSSFTFNWTPGNLLSDSTIANPIVTINEPATVYLSYYNSTCGGADSIVMDTGLYIGTEPIKFTPDYSNPVIIPNPNNGSFIIDFGIESPLIRNIHIYSVTGQLVENIDLSQEYNLGRFYKINMERQYSGIYYFHINTERHSFKGKLLFYK